MANQAPPISPLDRLRRTFITAHSVLRNIAYFRAARNLNIDSLPADQQDLKARITNNFLDIGVLEWCKLFVADERHAWNRVIPHQKRANFIADLLVHLQIDQAAWDAYVEELKRYRDKFLAHLDSDGFMRIPHLDIAVESTIFLGQYLQAHHPEAANIAAQDLELRTAFATASSAGTAYFV